MLLLLKQPKMIRKLAIVCGLLFIVFSLVAPAPMAFAQGKSAESQKEQKWNKRREERLKDYRDESGKVRPKKWKEGIEHYKQMEFTAGVSRFSSGSEGGSLEPAAAAGAGLSGVQWIQVGPKPAFPIADFDFQGNGAMSGEVLDIVIDPRNFADDVIYSVTNDGGVWRSTDGGVTFEQKTDHMPSLSMGAIALDPANPSIVYAGTGNLYDGNFTTTTLAVKAVGIYRSIDMGESWTILNPGGIFTGVGIARMAAPAANVLLVGTSNGLFKSVNGGMSFGQPPTYDDGQPIIGGTVEDIDLDPTDPANTIYASVSNQGIFSSTDQGDSFPTNLFSNLGAPAAGTFAYVRMAQGVSDTTRMYATVQLTGGRPNWGGLYRSDDTGATWTRKPSADAAGANGATGCQCGYDQTVAVDPQDADRVYIGFQELYFSSDGANSGFAVPGISRNLIHWDHHYLGWSPSTHWGGGGAPTPMWIGTDGGIHSTSDGGTTFNNFHNSTIASNLFHHMDIGRGTDANNDWTYGGTQDTGTIHSCAPGGHCGAAVLASGPTPWEMGINGDGTGVRVDQTNPLRAYGVQNGGYLFTNDGGKNWTRPNPANVAVPTTAWRYVIDFNDTTRVWTVTSTNGGFQPGLGLWRSNDATGTNWTSINTFTSNVRAIANTQTDSNVLWFGHTNGRVQNTYDATAVLPTFSGFITVTGAPGGAAVSELAINPLNPDEVVVTYRGICGGPCNDPDNRMRRIFRTTDRGLTWDDISGTDGNPVGNLPNLPTHSVVYDIGTVPSSIIVANDAGVLRSSNNGATWQKLGLGLPTADSKMLQIDDSVEPPLLRLATYGRSIWELAEAQGPILAVNADLGFDMSCIDERQTRLVQLFNVGSEVLTVNAIFRAEGSAEIRILAPSAPFNIQPGEEVDFTVEFLAATAGDHTAIIQINSNDQFEPSFQISASGTVNTQMISTVIADVGSFGGVCTVNDFHDLDLLITNPGCGLLEVSGINIMGTDSSDFDMAGVMAFPLQVAAGTSIAVPIRFDPAGSCGGQRTATLQIASDDPDTPVKDVAVSGDVPCPDFNVAIANSGAFGDVCEADFADLSLTLFNQGQCDLTISNITSDNALFVLPDDLQIPLVLSHDAEFSLPVRYAPMECDETGDSGTISIFSDSPGEGQVDITVSGVSPCPDLNVAIANSGDFGDVCKTDFGDLDLTLFNQGRCDLTISDITSDNVLFVLPDNLQRPLVLSHDADFRLPIRYAPEICTDIGDSGTISIISDSPDENPLDIPVSGLSPCPQLVIDPTGLTDLFAFPATVVDGDDSLGCYSDASTNLRNAGECPLTIDNISAANADYEVIQPTQFPILLPTGEETLAVTVRFTPVSGGDPLSPDEVLGTMTVISDDPDGPGLAPLCGEGVVQSGLRTLVTDITTGIPIVVDPVESMTVKTKGKKTPSPINLQFSDKPMEGPVSVCGRDVSWHLNLETLPATQTTGKNGQSQYEVNVKDGNLQDNRSFSLGQCEFREFQMQLKSSDGGDTGICLLKSKGESCDFADECCSSKCKGSSGNKTCK